jgi:hypothetical protein
MVSISDADGETVRAERSLITLAPTLHNRWHTNSNAVVRHIVQNHSACANDTVRANANTLQNRGIRTNVSAITNHHVATQNGTDCNV